MPMADSMLFLALRSLEKKLSYGGYLSNQVSRSVFLTFPARNENASVNGLSRLAVIGTKPETLSLPFRKNRGTRW